MKQKLEHPSLLNYSFSNFGDAQIWKRTKVCATDESSSSPRVSRFRSGVMAARNCHVPSRFKANSQLWASVPSFVQMS